MSKYNPIKNLINNGIELDFTVKVIKEESGIKVISTIVWDKNNPSDNLEVEQLILPNDNIFGSEQWNCGAETIKIGEAIKQSALIIANRTCRKHGLELAI